MSVKIRLNRTGKKGQISNRIVAIDTRKKRDGAFLEILGTFSKSTNRLSIDRERVNFWLAKGAIASDAVTKLLAPEKG